MLRELLLLGDESQNVGVLPDYVTNELLVKLLKHLVLGGPLNQYEVSEVVTSALAETDVRGSTPTCSK